MSVPIMSSQKIKLSEESDFYKGLKTFAVGVHAVKQEIEKIIVPIATAIHDVLKDIDPEKLINFIDRVQKFQKNEPYLTKLFDALKSNNNLSHAYEALSLAYFIQLIYENEDNPDDVDIFDVVNSKYFNEIFFSNFKTVQLGENFRKREIVLREALQLYELGFYAGCLSLLYGQLEGILTDLLVNEKALVKYEKHYQYVGRDIPKTHIKNNIKITGLSDKIIIAKNFNKYFEELDAYRIDSQFKINNDRNDILHGNVLDRFTKERCFILVIWLTSIFNFLKSEKCYLDIIEVKSSR